MSDSTRTLSSLETGKILAAHCMAAGVTEPFLHWSSAAGLTEIEAVLPTLRQLSALRLQRLLATRAYQRFSAEDTDSPVLQLVNNLVQLDGTPIGSVQTIYKPPLPHEIQARIAYEVFYQRFFDLLAQERQIVVLAENDYAVELFVPATHPFDLDRIWDETLPQLFDLETLRTSFIALVNSIKLTNRGFSALDVPILTSDQALTLAAFNLTNLHSLQAGDRRREIELEDIQQKITAATEPKAIDRLRRNQQKIKSDLETRRSRYGPLYHKWETVRQQVPGWSQRVEQLARREFSLRAGIQLSKAGAKIGRAVEQIGELISRLDQDSYDRIPCLFRIEPAPAWVKKAGDSQSHICYSCGAAIDRANRTYKANTFILADPSQRPQSGGSQKEPAICDACAALSFISPIKLGEGRLVVRLKHQTPARGYMLDDQLRMLALGELNIVAGRYALLQTNETIGAKLVIEPLGAVQYALYKVGSLFPAEVFAEYSPEVIIGGATIPLQRRQAAWMHWLIEIFGLRKSEWTDKGQFAAFGRAIRFVQKDNLVFAIYELLKGGLVDVSSVGRQRAHQLETLRGEQVRWLEMDQEQNKADFYRDIAGMTGLLYAFCNYVYSRTSDNERRIEVRKLIERVTDPYQFIYTAANTTGSEQATLYWDNSIRFSYEQAKALLERLNVSTAERETSSAKGQRQLTLYFDDVVQAYVQLFQEKYTTTKDQRDFLYALKLSLHARFPELIERKETD